MQRKKKNKLMQIRIDSETYEKLKDATIATGVSASQFAREAISYKLEAPDTHQLYERLNDIENTLKQHKK